VLSLWRIDFTIKPVQESCSDNILDKSCALDSLSTAQLKAVILSWDGLWPQHVTSATSLSVFRSRLKTQQLSLKANSAFHPSGVGK